MSSDSADKSLYKNLAAGCIAGALSLAVSCLVGLYLLHNRYYVEWVAAAIMGFYILIAWLLWLRDDAFMRRRQAEPARTSSIRARRVLVSAALFLAAATLLL